MGRAAGAMPLTLDQEARAQAWAKVFEDGAALTAVLDDMQGYAKSLAEPLERAGATAMILHILTQRSLLRRQKGKKA